MVVRTHWLLVVGFLVGYLSSSAIMTTTTTRTSGVFADALVRQDPIAIRVPPPGRPVTVLAAGGVNGDNSSSSSSTKKKPKKAQGVYVRPSGAIEKGSGFFVPGLEGPKVRLLIGVILLVATAVNHFVFGANLGSFGRTGLNSADDSGLLSFSEGTAVAYSLLLLFQSAIEYAKESLPEPGPATPSKAAAASPRSPAGEGTEVLNQKWSSPAGDDGEDDSGAGGNYRARIQWAAASYVSMTPTTQILLLARNGGEDDGSGCVRYRLGTGPDPGGGGERNGVAAALEQLSRSKGGRISLPLTHPAVEALLPRTGGGDDDENKLRTVILQRITDDSCWMVASDQLLAGYTQGDLRWLGKLAGYVAAAAPE